MQEYVSTFGPSVICVTETWANADSNLELTGYCIYRKDRINRAGGGVCIHVRDSLIFKEIDMETEVESVWCLV